jgi:hypothetical protein
LSEFENGAIGGILASLTTTLCNIFFTTAKQIVRIIRQTWASIVEAAKVLFLNPDNLSFGERMKAVLKILATGASIVIGAIVQETVSKIPGLSTLPVISEVLPVFCGSLATGLLAVTLLYFLDSSSIVKKLVSILNGIFKGIEDSIERYRKAADYFEKYAAELMKIDLERFKRETNVFHNISGLLESATSEIELRKILLNVYETLGIKKPWGDDDFDSFMSNKENHLVFE